VFRNSNTRPGKAKRRRLVGRSSNNATYRTDAVDARIVASHGRRYPKTSAAVIAKSNVGVSRDECRDGGRQLGRDRRERGDDAEQTRGQPEPGAESIDAGGKDEAGADAETEATEKCHDGERGRQTCLLSRVRGGSSANHD